MRWYKYGDPTFTYYADRATPEASFWARVDQSGGPDACWPWTGGGLDEGYGRLSWEGHLELAHRIAYMLTYGPPENDVLHDCDNPPCCNPTHLYDGTSSDNARDRCGRGRCNGGGHHRCRPSTKKA